MNTVIPALWQPFVARWSDEKNKNSAWLKKMEVSRPIAAPSCGRHPFNGDSDFYPVAEQLLRDHNIQLVIETGTYHGATTQFFARRVKRVITIEANRETFDKTSKVLASFSNVSCLLGDSADLFTTILPALDKAPVLFYLDAHWDESWPIHGELAGIAQSFANNCIIVIDDFQIPDHPEFGCDWFKGEALSLPHVRAGVEAALPNGHYQLYVPKQPPHRGRFIGRPASWQSELPCCQVAQTGAVPRNAEAAAHSISYLKLNGNASREALEDPRKFATFRQDPRIVQMMEHVSMAYARAYWEGVVRDFGALMLDLDWKSLAQLDAVGGPRRYDFAALVKPHATLDTYQFSTNFFRYLYTGLCLLRYVAEGSSAKKLSIVEIGGGYGGQCKALFALAPVFDLQIATYTLIDLEPAVALQMRFLEKAGVPVERLIAHSYEELCDLHFADLRLGYDLGFSNYCFSELNREVQDVYAKHVLPRCKQLYIIHNSAKMHPFVETDRFERSAEKPCTGPHNVVLALKQPLTVHLHDANFAHVHWTSIPLATAQGTYVLEYSRVCDPDVAVFTERCLEQAEKCNAARKVAWLCEPRGIIASERYSWVEKHCGLFDEIWTHERALVERLPQARWVVHASTWIAADKRQVYPKTKAISFIASSKNWTEGHKLRQSVRAKLPPTVDRFGGPDGQIESKVTALAPYRFSIVIENVQVETFVTEKLVDCFVTGTVPVYWGPRRIERWFDCDGVLFFDTIDDLLSLLPTLTTERYAALEAAVARNFQLAQTFLGATPPKRVQMELCGGLGNQLFQIATASEYAKRQSAAVFFSSSLSTGQRKRNYVQLFELACGQLAPGPSYKEPRFAYDPLPAMEQQLRLTGYFQSDLYVAGCKKFIYKCLEPWLPSATAYRSRFGHCTAVHIRRGDYLALADVHPPLPIEYYTTLLEQFPNEQVLVFSDDIAWCKTAFPTYHCVEASHECEELLIMSQCDVIIAANSTFSWWAGYLSAPGTKVVLPKRWFGTKGPPQWETIYYASMPIKAETETSLVFCQVPVEKRIASYYVNLARRADRRAQIEAELARAQVDAKRFEAIERSPGSMGCALSHVACMRDAMANDYDYALIIEDDFQFLVDAKTFHQTLDAILERYAGLEVVMLAYNDYKSLAQDELVRQAINVQTTACYVVSRNAMPKVIEVFERSAQALEKGLPATEWAIDMTWKKLQGEGKRFYISTKRLGKQRVSYSDIMGRVVDYRC